MIQQERIKELNDKPPRKGRYVLYWMQASQRPAFNHALEFAARCANELKQPLAAVFGITTRFPEANARHYAFMLEGLMETKEALRKRGVPLAILLESPEKAALHMAKEASLVVADRGYLKIQRAWRRHVAERAPCSVVQVESDVIVPVETASPKEEYSAATLRPKIHRLLDLFLVPLRKVTIKRSGLKLKLDGLDLEDPDELLGRLKVARSVPPSPFFKGGPLQAGKLLRKFLASTLKGYDTLRSDPAGENVSHMSPYLHFGQISPLEIALKVDAKKGVSKAAKAAYLEELIVRRELSMNFVYYNKGYDRFAALPEWARKTLGKHKKDRREYLYTLAQWEKARTHDPYWNAAQREMVITGKMHGYMRMYWGKKILEWSRTPEAAFKTALALNNKYELDGRDPNSFTGVAWCFGKHDRPWGERKVYGTVRCMTDGGLRRKFDMDAYLERVEALEEG